MEYIDNNPINGIKYDYNKINKEFKKMMKKCGAPDGLYDPTTIPLDFVKWVTLMSERSSSKTNQCLLYLMTINKLYGSKSVYVRKTSQMITQSQYLTMFDVITSDVYKYVEYLTNGKYNNIVVERTTKRCYYVKNDEAGKELERAPFPFLVLWSVDQYDRYASNFNNMDYDFILFDEFSWGRYQPDEFIHLCQIIATVRRNRLSVRIIMLSNTISPYNEYLKELGIGEHLAKMKQGDKAVITSQLGARVYVELLKVGIHNNVEFNRNALQYFGFENEALRSLYGGEWEIKGYKHLPRSKTREITPTRIILSYLNNKMRVCSFHDGCAVGVVLVPYTKEINNTHLIITDEPQYNTENVEIISYNIIRKLDALDHNGLLYMGDNEIGLRWSALRDSIMLHRNI